MRETPLIHASLGRMLTVGRVSFFAVLTACLFGLSACAKAPLHHQESFVFGTRVEILIAGMEEVRARLPG